jgi:hypothetical protein
MPRRSGVRFTVLVEDEALERFIRGILREIGALPREIRVVKYLKGRGDAKQRIYRQYPDEIRAHRRRQSENVALIVGADADCDAPQQMMQLMGEALQSAELEPRAPQERVAMLVPKRNIETWLLFLSGKGVDEDTDYKNQARDVDIKTAASAFIRRFRTWRRDTGAENNLPSLRLAFEEMTRVLAALDRAAP